MATRREILKKLDSLEPKIAKAFRDAVGEIKSRARLAELQAALEARDIERAWRAAGLREGGWTTLTESLRGAYLESGTFAAGEAPAALGFTFNINNPRAENWLRQRSSDLVTQINDEQREAIRTVLEGGMARGDNPRRTALDIVGRMDRRSGRRVGGIVGLTGQQASYVENMRDELLSGDSTAMRNYFSRKRRDKRFDGLVRRAIENGEAVSRADVDRITSRYSDRLMQTRGNAIGVTESTRAFGAARKESLDQAIEQGLARPENIRREWDATLDGKTRTTHAAANGQVVGPNEPFIVGGHQLQYPGDPSAPASETVWCRCFEKQTVDWVAEEMAA